MKIQNYILSLREIQELYKMLISQTAIQIDVYSQNITNFYQKAQIYSAAFFKLAYKRIEDALISQFVHNSNMSPFVHK